MTIKEQATTAAMPKVTTVETQAGSQSSSQLIADADSSEIGRR